MSEPATKAEYEAKYAANTAITGYGLEVLVHAPCPFCAEPEFLVHKVLEVSEALGNGAVCKHCHRGMRGIVTVSASGTVIGFVQTAGPDPAPWIQMPREVTS
jgi:hypothetical protein